jgi:hypothetical protein
MAQQPMDRIPQLVEKVKKLREERDAKVKALDDGVAAAEEELKQAVAEVKGTLDQALGAIGKRGFKVATDRRKRGQLMVEIEPLWKQGMSVDDIAAKLGASYGSVRLSIKRIEKKIGDRPPSVPIPVPQAPLRTSGDRAVVASPPPSRAALPDDDDDAASVDDLRRAVLASKNGTKVRLLTTIRSGHKHIADINRDGNGYTATSGRDGHVHAVKAFVVGAGPDGHRHDLTTEAA